MGGDAEDGDVRLSAGPDFSEIVDKKTYGTNLARKPPETGRLRALFMCLSISLRVTVSPVRRVGEAERGGSLRELALVELMVESALGEQLLMRSLLDDMPVAHDEDHIG